jgi:hypothetical protein
MRNTRSPKRLFSVAEFEGCRFAIGVRNANNKRLIARGV